MEYAYIILMIRVHKPRVPGITRAEVVSAKIASEERVTNIDMAMHQATYAQASAPTYDQARRLLLRDLRNNPRCQWVLELMR